MSDIPRMIEARAQEMDFSRPLFTNDASNIPFSRSWDCYYPEGIVGTRGAFPPFLHVVIGQRWDDVQDLQCKRKVSLVYDREHGSVMSTGMTRYQAAFTDGTAHKFAINEDSENTLARDYFRWGIRRDVRPQIAAANMTRGVINQTVAKAQFPRILQTIEKGERASFGPICADQQGIYTTNNGLSFPWQTTGIGEVIGTDKVNKELLHHNHAVQASILRLKTEDYTCEFPTAQIRNFGALALLCRHMDAQ